MNVSLTFTPGDFETSARAVLTILRKRTGFDLWMLTRTKGDDRPALQTGSAGFNLMPGSISRWQDTLCYQMAQGNGTRVAPQVELIPAYAAAPLRDGHPAHPRGLIDTWDAADQQMYEQKHATRTHRLAELPSMASL